MNLKKGFKRTTLLISLLAFCVSIIFFLSKEELVFDDPFGGTIYLPSETWPGFLGSVVFLSFLSFLAVWVIYYVILFIVVPIVQWIIRGFADREI